MTAGVGDIHLQDSGEQPASHCVGDRVLVCACLPIVLTHPFRLSPGSKLECACRRILHRPSDLQWRLLSYREADEALAITDLQRLEHASLASVIPIDTGAQPRPRISQRYGILDLWNPQTHPNTLPRSARSLFTGRSIQRFTHLADVSDLGLVAVADRSTHSCRHALPSNWYKHTAGWCIL